ncbi:MAG: hypothetical protein QM372_09020 [Bacillota bacterium]|jgi:hypothetical protein|nr:hypothetical protein [Bacillota bacterium]
MVRHKVLAAVLLATVMLGIALGVEASGTVTFFVKIEPGLKISSPDTLTFAPVAPGQTDVQDLNITVWSNVRWQLLVEAIGYGGEGGLRSTLEIGDLGNWHELSAEGDAVYVGQPPTGSEGITMGVPFRFTPSFADEPDDYSFQVKLTVVPAL